MELIIFIDCGTQIRLFKNAYLRNTVCSVIYRHRYAASVNKRREWSIFNH